MQIVKAPNHILRQDASLVKKITPRHRDLIQEMIKTTLTFQDPEGVGLAATQVGISEQFFIAKFDDPESQDTKSDNLTPPIGNKQTSTSTFTAVFNPKIHWFSKKVRMTLEGCLSIPEYYGEVTRPFSVKVSYQTIDGREIKETLKGVNATIFQHEYDHLHGKLFIDYVMAQKSKLFKITGKDASGADIFEEVVL